MFKNRFLFVACLVASMKADTLLSTAACIETFDTADPTVSHCDSHQLQLPALTHLVQSGISYKDSFLDSSSIAFAQLHNGVHLGIKDSSKAVSGLYNEGVESDSVAAITDSFDVLAEPAATGELQFTYHLSYATTISSIAALVSNGVALYFDNSQVYSVTSSTSTRVNRDLTFTSSFALGSEIPISIELVGGANCFAQIPKGSCDDLLDATQSADLVGFHVLDDQGHVIDQLVKVKADSGLDYFSVNSGSAPSGTTPEPSAIGLASTRALLLVVWRKNKPLLWN